MFKEIGSKDTVNLEQWISWAMEHIATKAAKLPKVKRRLHEQQKSVALLPSD
jgi:hypothetical protein